MPYGSAKNGRNNCRHHLRSITNQNIIDEIVESRIDEHDSTWRPNESPTEIRRGMFQQARMFSEYLGFGGDGSDTNTPAAAAYNTGMSTRNGTTLHNGTTYNGRSCNGPLRYSNGASRIPSSAITSTRPRWHASPASPLNGQANGDARQADSLSNDRVVGHNGNNDVNSWEKDVPSWRSRSSSSERRRVFGSQDIDGEIEYGDMAVYNAAAIRTTQTSPINLSLSKPEAAPLNLTNTSPSSLSERELTQSHQSGSSGKSCSSHTDVAPTLSRNNSDEVGDSGQSHWKKIMVSNITQQERQ